jgi:hypothetical protein
MAGSSCKGMPNLRPAFFRECRRSPRPFTSSAWPLGESDDVELLATL